MDFEHQSEFVYNHPTGRTFMPPSTVLLADCTLPMHAQAEVRNAGALQTFMRDVVHRQATGESRSEAQLHAQWARFARCSRVTSAGLAREKNCQQCLSLKFTATASLAKSSSICPYRCQFGHCHHFLPACAHHVTSDGVKLVTSRTYLRLCVACMYV